MKISFSPTCDRYGHILTGIGGLPQAMAPSVLPTAEEIALLPGDPGNGLASTGPTIEVAGELVRKADCPVLPGRAIASES